MRFSSHINHILAVFLTEVRKHWTQEIHVPLPHKSCEPPWPANSAFMTHFRGARSCYQFSMIHYPKRLTVLSCSVHQDKRQHSLLTDNASIFTGLGICKSLRRFTQHFSLAQTSQCLRWGTDILIQERDVKWQFEEKKKMSSNVCHQLCTHPSSWLTSHQEVGTARWWQLALIPALREAEVEEGRSLSLRIPQNTVYRGSSRRETLPC